MKGCNIVIGGNVTTLVCTTVTVRSTFAETANCVRTDERTGAIEATGIVTAAFRAVTERTGTEGSETGFDSVRAGTAAPGTVKAIPANSQRVQGVP